MVELFQHRIRERGLFLRGLFSWVGFPCCPVHFRAAFAAGLVLGTLGAVTLAVALARSLTSGAPFLSGEAVVGLVIGLTGVQLVFLGVLGEYLGAVLDEVRARPHYVVEERINLEAPGSRPR